MKRLIMLGTCLMVLTLALSAQDTGTEGKKSARSFSFSRRYFEIGFGAGVGFGNNLIGAGDIFQKNIVIDLNDLGDKIGDKGVNLDFDVEGDLFFFNVNMLGNWGFGLRVGLDGGIYANIPKSFFTLIAEGNTKDHSPTGDFTVSGGIFADVGVNVHAKLFKKLKISLTPAMYVPIVYIPKSTIRYVLEAENSLSFAANAALTVYGPFSLDSGDNIQFDLSSLMEGTGFDLSLNAEYPLSFFSSLGVGSLDVGATITHIPLSPAVLNYGIDVSIDDFKIDGSNILQGSMPEIPELELKKTNAKASYKVYRPLRFDFYALYKPFTTTLLALTLRPNIGFTVLNASEEANFNWGVEAQLDLLGNLLQVHLGTGYEETQWKHRLGLALNLRVFELDIEAGLRSPSFANSFMINGFSLGVGIRTGW